MPRILTSALTLSWAVIFGLVALGVLPDGGSRLNSLPALFGLGAPLIAATGQNAVVGYLLALFCLTSSVLFVWAFTVSLSGGEDAETEGDEVCRAAFAAGAGALTLSLVAGGLMLVPGFFVLAMASLAALVASYIATFLERFSMMISQEPGPGDIKAVARLMAMGAAHNSLLSRISGRNVRKPEDGRT